MKQNKTVNILGVHFANTTMDKLVNDLEERLIAENKTFIVTANPEIVMHAKNDHSYCNIINKADFITADGIGVVKAAGILNQPLPERVAGYDLMLELLKVADNKKLKIYLLGAKEEVISLAVKSIEEKYTNLDIVGYHNGYFDWENHSLQEEIISMQPDLVFVALGFPKQEQWISENITYFEKGLFMGVGGSFDVIAGTAKRAPLVWQKLNIEWLYRLLKNPSRWRRMAVLPKFLFVVLNKKIRG